MVDGHHDHRSLGHGLVLEGASTILVASDAHALVDRQTRRRAGAPQSTSTSTLRATHRRRATKAPRALRQRRATVVRTLRAGCAWTKRTRAVREIELAR
jgi:hypothetical protein